MGNLLNNGRPFEILLLNDDCPLRLSVEVLLLLKEAHHLAVAHLLLEVLLPVEAHLLEEACHLTGEVPLQEDHLLDVGILLADLHRVVEAHLQEEDLRREEKLMHQNRKMIFMISLDWTCIVLPETSLPRITTRK